VFLFETQKEKCLYEKDSQRAWRPYVARHCSRAIFQMLN